MSVTPRPAHLSSHHQNTLTQIFQHPVSHNIEWRAVLSLLQAIGSVEESHDGKYRLTLGPESEMFEFRGDKDVDTQQVVDLRRMLRNAGYGPETDTVTADH